MTTTTTRSLSISIMTAELQAPTPFEFPIPSLSPCKNAATTNQRKTYVNTSYFPAISTLITTLNAPRV